MAATGRSISRRRARLSRFPSSAIFFFGRHSAAARRSAVTQLRLKSRTPYVRLVAAATNGRYSRNLPFPPAGRRRFEIGAERKRVTPPTTSAHHLRTVVRVGAIRRQGLPRSRRLKI